MTSTEIKNYVLNKIKKTDIKLIPKTEELNNYKYIL